MPMSKSDKSLCTLNIRAGDRVGCVPGLVCGVNNCAKFHEIGAATGIPSMADCCEGKLSLRSD